MKVNVYVDINPLTKKIFYVGIGDILRCKWLKRNKLHQAIVQTLPDNKFERKIIYNFIDLDKAYLIEIQIIKKCGRICNGTGYLTNIHPGGPLEMNSNNYKIHWLKNKTWSEVFGKERADEILKEQITNRTSAVIERHQKFGLSEAEKQRYEKIKEYHKQGVYDKGREITMERRRAGNYTEAELEAHKQCKERQLGKSMQKRLNDPNWTNPKEGKSMIEITGNQSYQPWNKGKNMKEIKGESYIFPTSKSFKLFCNNQEVGVYKCERDFIEKTNLNSPTLCKLKRNSQHVIKRQKNSSHSFKTGDILTFEWIT